MAKELAKERPGPPEAQTIPSTYADIGFETPTYHLNDLDLSIVDNQVDPFALPQSLTADRLINNYFDTVQPVFPILQKELFIVQYESVCKFSLAPESRRWLSVLNAVFAIGAVFSHLVEGGNERDHVHFFTRARALFLNGGVVYEVVDLQQVQVTVLMGVYLMATSQINR